MLNTEFCERGRPNGRVCREFRDILRTKNPGVFVTITSCYPIVLN